MTVQNFCGKKPFEGLTERHFPGDVSPEVNTLAHRFTQALELI